MTSDKSNHDSTQRVKLDDILHATDSILPYNGITVISMPSEENAWVKIKKINRTNTLRALLPDELEYNRTGKISQKKLLGWWK